MEMESDQAMPLKRADIERLHKAVQFSRKRMERARRTRRLMSQSYCGIHLSDDGAQQQVPVNLLEMAVNTYLRYLLWDEPRCIVVPKDPALRAFGIEFETALNHVLAEINLAHSMERGVLDAMFMFSPWKVGVTPKQFAEVLGFRHDAGQPFADPIDPDDWVHDMTATCWERCQFMGDRYRITVEAALESGLIDRKEEDMIAPARVMQSGGEAKTQAIGAGEETDFEEVEFQRTVTLWDICVPSTSMLYTFLADSDGQMLVKDKPLRTVEWEGPEAGPYHMLHFNTVPGNILPLPPMQVLWDLHSAAQIIFSKLVNQAKEVKYNTLVPGSQKEDIGPLNRAKDGEAVAWDTLPIAPTRIRFGEVDTGNIAFYHMLREQFEYFGGNLGVLAGLRSEAATLGQEQLIAQQASQRVQKMQEHVTQFMQGIVESIADHLFYDPATEFNLVKRIPGTSIEIPFRYGPDLKEGDFLDFNVKVEPFGARAQSPGDRLRVINQAIQQYATLAPLMEAQGIVLDLQKWFEYLARYTGVDEVKDLLTQGRAPQGTAGLDRNRPRQSPVTQRTNIRRSEASANGSGGMSQQLQSLVSSAARSQSE